MLACDLRLELPRFTLAVRWETSEASLGVFGHSGAGKTTLLETLAGVRRGARGVIRVNGQTWLDSERGINQPPERRGMGYVPQDVLLFPHRDVLGNLLAGRRRAERAGRRVRPERVLEILELAELQRRPVTTLSGGERQRVALGRALCSSPDLLLLDEPLAGLDLPLRRRVLAYLLAVREEFSIPSIYVSHDAAEVRMLSNEMIVMACGSVIARGSPAKILTELPALPLAGSGGFENVLSGRVLQLVEAAAEVELAPGLHVWVAGQELAAGQQVTISVRADDLILATQAPSGLSAQNILAGTVREIREVDASEGGPLLVVLVELKPIAAPLAVAITRQACRQLGLEPGMSVHLVSKAHAWRVLAAR